MDYGKCTTDANRRPYRPAGVENRTQGEVEPDWLTNKRTVPG